MALTDSLDGRTTGPTPEVSGSRVQPYRRDGEPPRHRNVFNDLVSDGVKEVDFLPRQCPGRGVPSHSYLLDLVSLQP